MFEKKKKKTSSHPYSASENNKTRVDEGNILNSGSKKNICVISCQKFTSLFRSHDRSIHQRNTITNYNTIVGSHLLNYKDLLYCSLRSGRILSILLRCFVKVFNQSINVFPQKNEVHSKMFAKDEIKHVSNGTVNGLTLIR